MKTLQIRDDFGLEISDIDFCEPLSDFQFMLLAISKNRMGCANPRISQ
jgi:hypothetical protein